MVVSVEKLRYLLLWCTILNYGFVIFWFLLVVLARRPLHTIWGKWFHLSGEQFDRLNFMGMMLYKIGILLFNLVPLVALLIVR
jgi:hypothetical protein